MPCSSAIFLIQRSALIDSSRVRGSRASRRPQAQRRSRNSTSSVSTMLDEDRRRQRKVEREVAAPDGEVARQPADRQPSVISSRRRDHEADDDQATHRSAACIRARGPRPTARDAKQSPHGVSAAPSRGRSSRARTPPSPAHPTRASRCARSTAPNSLRSVPASALAGSVAPISVRHFLIASGASSASSTHGPDDMKSVSAPKNGRARWTA